jgi:dCMP deaminase
LILTRTGAKRYKGQLKDQDKWDRRFLDLAQHVGSWSKDPSTRTGAVIVDRKGRIVSVGFNGLPQGVDDLPERLNDRALKYKMFAHAERNAIIFAAQPLDGCTLYTWPFMSCAPCAAMVIQTGISRAVAPYSENERWVEDFKLSETMFAEANVELCLFKDHQDLPFV